MKVTNIRTNKNEIPSTDIILAVENSLKRAFEKAGFISHASATIRTEMKIGLRMCSFRVNISKLGYNADFGNCGRMTKKGYKLTSIPTYAQRESFNHIVNDVFDKFKLSAKIMSGKFEVRNAKTGRINSWSNFVSAYDGGTRSSEIVALKDVA